MERYRASVISREDLIRNNLAGGCEQDLADVKVLRKAAQALEKKSAQ